MLLELYIFFFFDCDGHHSQPQQSRCWATSHKNWKTFNTCKYSLSWWSPLHYVPFHGRGNIIVSMYVIGIETRACALCRLCVLHMSGVMMVHCLMSLAVCWSLSLLWRCSLVLLHFTKFKTLCTFQRLSIIYYSCTSFFGGLIRFSFSW